MRKRALSSRWRWTACPRRASIRRNRTGRVRSTHAPFAAYPIMSANCFTFGGLKVNSKAQVLDSGRPGHFRPLCSRRDHGHLSPGLYRCDIGAARRGLRSNRCPDARGNIGKSLAVMPRLCGEVELDESGGGTERGPHVGEPERPGAALLFIAIGLFFALTHGSGCASGRRPAWGRAIFPSCSASVLVGFGLLHSARPPSTAGGADRAGALARRWPHRRRRHFLRGHRKGLGIAPSMFAAAMMASTLDRPDNAILPRLLLSLCLTAFCVLLFIYGLRLPFRVLGPWLTG